MSASRHAIKTMGAVALACASLSAHSYVAFLDRLQVIRDGVTFHDDTFADGLPPPNTPGFNCGTAPNCYQVNGAFAAGAEAGGKLRFDTTLGDFSENAAGNPRQVVHARLLSNRSDEPADINAGLKIHRTFTAAATYDLNVPGPGDAMQIRFTDAHANASNAGHQTDYLQLQVFGSTTAGQGPLLRFIDQNFPADTLTILATQPLNAPANADQIRLILSHPVANSTQVFASWEFLSTGTVVGSGSFPTAGNIFDGETWTRVDAIVSAVPEPSTYALMLAGLGLIGCAARWRKMRGNDGRC
jgi:hypothetical protein